MTGRTTVSERIGAFRAEREAVYSYCRDLTAEEWDSPSAAEDWRVRDVVAHLEATSRAFLTPGLLTIARSKQIERSNDVAVQAQRDRRPDQLLDGFYTWSGRGAALLRVGTVEPMGSMRIRIGELGYYPLRIMPSTAIFDWHVHLRHDIATVLDRPVPPTDEPRMGAVVEWMLALLERSQHDRLDWLRDPIVLTLDGLGGGTWRLEPTGSPGRLRAIEGNGRGAAAHITSRSEYFPLWATTRGHWRDSDLTITGDEGLAAKVLDSINLI